MYKIAVRTRDNGDCAKYLSLEKDEEDYRKKQAEIDTKSPKKSHLMGQRENDKMCQRDN